MKHNSKYFHLLVIFVIFTACSKQYYSVHSMQEVSKEISKNGLFYYLPQTNLQLEVLVEKIDKIKGPYSAYAGKLLGLTNTITENSSTYSIIGMKLHTQTEANSNQIYYISLSNKQKKQLSLQLNEQGLLRSINMPEVETPKKAIMLTGSSELDFQTTSNDFQMYLNYNILEKIDTIFETIHLDTMKMQKQVLKRSFIEKTPEQKATEIAEYIIKLREQKIGLLTGYQEVAYSEPTLHFMVQSIDDLINEYVALFTGKIVTDVMTYKFDMTPQQSSQNEPMFAFTFSRKNGIIKTPTQDKTNNYYVVFSTKNSTRSIEQFVNTNQQDSKEKIKGIYYNIPELTNIRIVNNRNEIIYETKLMIHQFGTVHYLPANKHTQVLFHEFNATLQQIHIE